MSHARQYLLETSGIAGSLDPLQLDLLAADLAAVRERGGRLFFLGVGGSAANASHAVNDFRKLCGLEAYAPSDNVAELTARINDEGWEASYSGWLVESRLDARDALFVLSVGGGNPKHGISMNLVSAITLGKERGASVFGIVGRDGGFTAEKGDRVVVIPTVAQERVTPHAEAFQSVICHLLVSHPSLKQSEAKWESSDAR
jgi:D-sedoheptulose 7-phosphate isomerase